MSTLNLDDIQSEILCGYGRGANDPPPGHAQYVLLTFPKDGKADAVLYLRELLGTVTWAADWDKAKAHVNVAFSYRGLHELFRLDPQLLDDSILFDEFRQGMVARAEKVLADDGESAPAKWTFSDGDCHLLLLVQGPTQVAVDAARTASLQSPHLKSATTQILEANRLTDGREHFGFLDGVSQPVIDGVAGDPKGHGVPQTDGTWRPLKPGELVLGYEDETGPYGDTPLLENGSFFVLRKLAQRVHEFQTYVKETAEHLGLEPDELAAKMMGRQRSDGAPVIRNANGLNDFRYASDPIGFQCPHGAHIRRANPRDSLNRVGDGAERHRMARRTLMYTENAAHQFVLQTAPVAPTAPEDDLERGMLFGAFNAAIGRQFEFVQSAWLNRGGSATTSLLGTRDPLTGSHRGHGAFVIPGAPMQVAGGLERFVVTKGGGYFFVPGRGTLELLAEQQKGMALRKRIDAFRTALHERLLPPKDDTTWLRHNLAKFSGWSADIAKATSLFRRKKKHADDPEKRLFVSMTPVIDGQRAQLSQTLDNIRQLDAVFARMLDKREKPLIHHARFVVTPHFHYWKPQVPSVPADDVPQVLSLPNNDAYLLFACWFDGPDEQLFDNLARAAKSDHWPLRYCHGFPKGERDIAAYLKHHRLPSTFAYRSYLETTAEIRDALAVRAATFDFLSQRTVGDKPDDAALVIEFLTENARYLG